MAELIKPKSRKKKKSVVSLEETDLDLDLDDLKEILREANLNNVGPKEKNEEVCEELETPEDTLGFVDCLGGAEHFKDELSVGNEQEARDSESGNSKSVQMSSDHSQEAKEKAVVLEIYPKLDEKAVEPICSEECQEDETEIHKKLKGEFSIPLHPLIRDTSMELPPIQESEMRAKMIYPLLISGEEEEVLPPSGIVCSPTAPVMEDEDNELGIKLSALYPCLEQSEVFTMLPFTQDQIRTLYYNPVIENLDDIIDKFFQNNNMQFDHEFYRMVLSYLESLDKKGGLSKDIEALQKNKEEFKELIWETETHNDVVKGYCQDGSPVQKVMTYETATVNEGSCLAFAEAQRKLREVLHGDFVMSLFDSHSCKLRIENYISDFLEENPELSLRPNIDPLQGARRNYILEQGISELKQLISILFAFQRKPITSSIFLSDIRKWLSIMVSRLLLHATLEDHLFLTLHVLHCPPGISHWAVGFVQPTEMFSRSRNFDWHNHDWDNQEFNHNIALLALILKPMKYREEMLTTISMKIQQMEEAHEDQGWILVDSDGEDDEDTEGQKVSFHEKDILSLLNQLSFEKSLKYLFMPSEDETRNALFFSNESNFVKMLAFARQVVDILGLAMRNYPQAKYKRLNRKLGQMIKNIVHSLCLGWMVFKEGHLQIPNHMSQRIQLESDVILLLSVIRILQAPSLGAWQYMSILPFDVLSNSSVWNLLRLIHLLCWNAMDVDCETFLTEQECKEVLRDERTASDFVEKLLQMSSVEATFLLTTLAFVARMRAHYDVLEFITEEIFNISFVNVSTRTLYSKLGKELLQSICLQHLPMLNKLLELMKTHLEVTGMATSYLVQALPLHLLQLSVEDCKMIRGWLVQVKPNEPANHLSRMILNSLNWSLVWEENPNCSFQLDRSDEYFGSVHLFLPRSMHNFMALSTLEALNALLQGKSTVGKLSSSAVMTFPTDFLSTNGSSSRLTSLLSLSQGHQDELILFSTWSWCFCLRLKLHSFSILAGKYFECKRSIPGDHIKGRVLFQITDSIVDFVQNPRMEIGDDARCDEIEVDALEGRSLLSTYLSLCLTRRGYSTEEFQKTGLKCVMDLLEANNATIPGLHILFNCIPMFYHNNSAAKDLLSNDIFIKCVEIILKQDAMDKTSFDANSRCSITCQMASLILIHMELFAGRIELFENVITFWLQILTKQLNWSSNRDVLYIMNNIFKKIFSVDPHLKIPVTFLKEYLKRTENEGRPITTNPSGFFSSIAGLFWSRSSEFLSESSASREFPWFRFAILRAERGAHEEENNLWRSLESKVFGREHSAEFVELAHEEVCSKVGIDHTVFPVQKLSIFRFASMILESPSMHELLPLMWNEFLGMYFTRSSQGKSHGLGYNLLSYSPESRILMKNLKAKCIKCIDELKAQRDKFTDLRLSDKLIQLHQVILLWLDEQRLHDPRLNLTMLPPQYAASLFQSLVSGQQYYWFGFMDHGRMAAELDATSDLWFQNTIDRNARPHQDHLNKLSQSLGIKTPQERLLTYFNSKPPNDPIPAPQVEEVESVFSELVTNAFLDCKKLKVIIHADLKTVCDMASSYEKKVTKHKEMDDFYLDNFKKIYSNVTVESVEIVQCWSLLNPTHKCKGGAVLKKRHERKQLNEIAYRKANETKDLLTLLIKDCSKLAPLLKASRAVIRVEAIIHKIIRRVMKASQKNYTAEDFELANRFTETGIDLFYLLVSFISPLIEHCPMAKEFTHSCIGILGEAFVVNNPNQPQTLLLVILKTPELVCLLSQFFNPNSNYNEFLSLYGHVQMLSKFRKYDAAAAIAAKFDIGLWTKYSLSDQQSNLKLLELILSALACLGMKPSNEALSLACIHRSHLQILCSTDLSFYVMPLLVELLSLSKNQGISPEVWDDYSSLLGVNFIMETSADPNFESTFNPNNSHLITKHQIFHILDHTRDYFNGQLVVSKDESYQWKLRGSSGEHPWLYGKWRTYVPHLSRVFYSTVVLMVRKLHDMLVTSTSSDDASVLRDIKDMHDRIQSLFLTWINWSDCLDQCWREDSMTLISCLPEISCMISSWLKSIEILHSHFERGDDKHQGRILNHLLSFYTSDLNVHKMPELLVNAFNVHLITLPWCKLQPQIVCINNMVKAINYPKPCFEMVGNIFCAINWRTCFPLLIRNISTSENSKLHSLVFFMLIRLANERVILENTQLPQLLSSTDIFDWPNMLDAQSYSQSLDWFAASCDPTPLITLDLSLTSCQVIKLLKVASNFYPKNQHIMNKLYPECDVKFTELRRESIFKKRCSYINFMVRLVARASSSENPNFDLLNVAVSNLLSEIEAIMSREKESSQKEYESRKFCSESLFLLNLCPSSAANNFFQIFQQWMESSVMSPLLTPMVFSACKTITNVSFLSKFLEVFITVYFSLDVCATEHCGWNRVLASVEFPEKFQDEFVAECLDKEHFFTLYSFVLFKLSICQSLNDELVIMLKLNDWNTSAKPSAGNEAKMFLWWHKILELGLRQVSNGGSKLAVRSALVQMVPALMILGEDRSGTGIFGAIGFGKKSSLSLRFRMVACGLAGFVSSILTQDINLQPSSEYNDLLSTSLKATDAQAVAQLQQQSASRLREMSSDKTYSNYSHHIQLLLRFSLDKNLTLLNFREILSQLVGPLFPEYYLGILHSDVPTQNLS